MVHRSTMTVKDDDVWQRFVSFVIRKHNSTKGMSEENEQAIKEYLERHEREYPVR